MTPAAQVLFDTKIAEIRATGRFPSLLDFARATNAAREEADRAPANDNDEPGPLLSLDEAFVGDERVPGLVTAAPSPTPSTTPASSSAPVPVLVTKRPSRSRRQRRRSGLRQKEDARRLRSHGRELEREVVVKHLPPSPNHIPSTETETGTDHESTTGKTARASTTITTGPTYRRRIASWEDAGELPRILSVNRALEDFGRPFAFSINISPDLIRAANEVRRGFVDHMRRRLALTLKRTVGARQFWLKVETDEHGRPHVHGGIALTVDDVPVEIEGVLAKAGGNWTRQGSAPADVREQHDPDGWAAYACKRVERTRHDLREAAGLGASARVRLASYTDELRQAGERLHEQFRRAIQHS